MVFLNEIVEPNKISKTLAKAKIIMARTQSYIALYNMILILGLWLEKNNPLYAVVGLMLVLVAGIFDWIFIIKAEQQIHIQKNPEWSKTFDTINEKLSKIEKIVD